MFGLTLAGRLRGAKGTRAVPLSQRDGQAASWAWCPRPVLGGVPGSLSLPAPPTVPRGLIPRQPQLPFRLS